VRASGDITLRRDLWLMFYTYTCKLAPMVRILEAAKTGEVAAQARLAAAEAWGRSRYLGQ
jgi:hypothetical protein